MATVQQTLATGARCTLKCNGVLFGHMTDWSVDATFTTQAAECCGSPIDEANCITGKKVNLTASRLFIVDSADNPTANGMIPTSDPLAIITFPEKDVTIHDSVTDAVIGKAIGCMPTTCGDMRGSARGIVTTNVGWTARNYLTQAEL